MDTMTEEKLLEKFLELSDKALAERDVEKIIELLSEREPYAADLINHRIKVDLDFAKESVAREMQIHRKLKEERLKVLRKMDELARGRSASRNYVSKFAIPPMPMFFDKMG
jgi:hypothetical protein